MKNYIKYQLKKVKRDNSNLEEILKPLYRDMTERGYDYEQSFNMIMECIFENIVDALRQLKDKHKYDEEDD